MRSGFTLLALYQMGFSVYVFECLVSLVRLIALLSFYHY